LREAQTAKLKEVLFARSLQARDAKQKAARTIGSDLTTSLIAKANNARIHARIKSAQKTIESNITDLKQTLAVTMSKPTKRLPAPPPENSVVYGKMARQRETTIKSLEKVLHKAIRVAKA
jgi:hypothetical protein